MQSRGNEGTALAVRTQQDFHWLTVTFVSVYSMCRTENTAFSYHSCMLSVKKKMHQTDTDNNNLAHISFSFQFKLHLQFPFTLYFLLLNDVSRCFCFDLFSIRADVCVEACDRFGSGEAVGASVKKRRRKNKRKQMSSI